MKESEDKNWKEEILKDFEKPTHSGFTDEVLQNIGEVEHKQSFRPAPLISAKGWFFTALIFGIVVLLAVFVEYKIEFEFGFIEDYSEKLLKLLNDNTPVLWIIFSLVAVLFVLAVMNQKRFTFK